MRQSRCETGVTVGELVLFTFFLAWVGYYMWLVNSLVVQFEENEGEAMVKPGIDLAAGEGSG